MQNHRSSSIHLLLLALLHVLFTLVALFSRSATAFTQAPLLLQQQRQPAVVLFLHANDDEDDHDSSAAARITNGDNNNHNINNNRAPPFVATTAMSFSRRDLVATSLNKVAAAVFVATVVAAQLQQPESALASGGATAGRYTTIPIAKRRYYGRVQQAVHEFLEMGQQVVKGDMTATKIQSFFDVQGTVVVAAKRKDVNGQCTKKDGDCKGREIRDSRYNDMKASMYLLANAFRTDQQKPPDRLPTVKAARAFFKEMNDLEKLVVTNKPKQSDSAAVQHYAAALDILDVYLDLVELPPIDSGHYEKEFDTLVGETARIT